MAIMVDYVHYVHYANYVHYVHYANYVHYVHYANYVHYGRLCPLCPMKSIKSILETYFLLRNQLLFPKGIFFPEIDLESKLI